jgi:hypothetical protein
MKKLINHILSKLFPFKDLTSFQRLLIVSLCNGKNWDDRRNAL